MAIGTPLDIRAQAQGTDSILLTWNAVPEADGYRVYRSEDRTGAYALIGTANSTRLIDTAPNPNTVYYYKVSAFTASEESPASAPVSVATGDQPTLPITPSELNGRNLTCAINVVRWNPVGNVSGYRLYRSEALDGTYVVINETSATQILDKNLKGDTSYFYRVTAFDSSGESPMSTPITVTTRPCFDPCCCCCQPCCCDCFCYVPSCPPRCPDPCRSYTYCLSECRKPVRMRPGCCFPYR